VMATVLTMGTGIGAMAAGVVMTGIGVVTTGDMWSIDGDSK
jgi:hypothetical protein